LEIFLRQVRNSIHFLSIHLKHYQQEVWELIQFFDAFNICPIPHSLNCDANLLANVASRLIPSEGLTPDTFYVELLYMPSVPKNETNWRVLDDYYRAICTLKDRKGKRGEIDVMRDYPITVTSTGCLFLFRVVGSGDMSLMT
jgi:hypothetical protein